MEQYTSNLLSGFAGAVIGVFGALYIDYRNRKVGDIQQMLALVYSIGFKSWWEGDDLRPGIIFHENYTELWTAYAALRASLPCYKRNELDTAWHKYMMINYDQIPNGQISKIFLKGVPKTKAEAVERSVEFVSYLLKLR